MVVPSSKQCNKSNSEDFKASLEFMEDFFISYNKADRLWASGIGDWLDQAGYTTIIQERDFAAGSNFMSEMHSALQNARRLLLILSPDFLGAKFPEAEWTAALASDPTGESRTVVPVRVRECQPTGLLKPIVYIDLVGLNADEARKKLLDDLRVVISRKPRKSTAAAAIAPAQVRSGTSINLTATGDGNFQIVGDVNNYQMPPTQKVVLERREGAISTAQEKKIAS